MRVKAKTIKKTILVIAMLAIFLSGLVPSLAMLIK
jgi:hypothetical protein